MSLPHCLPRRAWQSVALAVRGPASVGSHAQSCIFKRMMSVQFHTRCADMLQGRQIFILRSRISPPKLILYALNIFLVCLAGHCWYHCAFQEGSPSPTRQCWQGCAGRNRQQGEGPELGAVLAGASFPGVLQWHPRPPVLHSSPGLERSGQLLCSRQLCGGDPGLGPLSCVVLTSPGSPSRTKAAQHASGSDPPG